MSATALLSATASQRSPTTNEAPTLGYLRTLSWIARRPLPVASTPILLATADRGP
jgi:hypothetical protein